MTTQELEKLTPKEKHAAIAEHCGWQYRDGYIYGRLWKDALQDAWHEGSCPPDYLRDLNAIHDVVVHFTRNEGQWFWDVFRTNLERINPSEFWNATAEQRCDAFLLSVI